MTEFDTTSPHHTDAAQGRQSKPSARGAEFNRCPARRNSTWQRARSRATLGLRPSPVETTCATTPWAQRAKPKQTRDTRVTSATLPATAVT